MARTNLHRAGFQFWKPKSGYTGIVEPVVCCVKSGANASYAMRTGDPVKWETGSSGTTPGSVELTAPAAGVYGVIAHVVQYRNSDGKLVRNGKQLPAALTWTADQDRTLVAVWPAAFCQFVVDATTAITSMVFARGYVGKNVAHLSLAAADARANSALGLSGQAIDNSNGDTTIATTNTFDWRIVDVLDQASNDPTQANFRFIVEANLSSNATYLPSTTGV